MRSKLALLYHYATTSCFALRIAPPSGDGGLFLTSNDANQTIGFRWDTIVATPYLNYTPCYDGFECARLEVPIDWTDSSNSDQVQLAIIRLPASVPEDDSTFGGTVIFNPGGPGGSGVDTMRWFGHGIRGVIDGSKNFELLSWDPRGIHYTTPSMSCFKNDWQRDVWSYRNSVIGPMDASNASLTQKWALAESFGKLCEETYRSKKSNSSTISQFATTALVARDLVAIIDQVEEHRSDVLRKKGALGEQHVLQADRPALLNYWGYSYGSYLGNTFASMFPSRVGRMILDSVVDSDDYTATGWFSNLQDYHKNLEFFCKDCFEAGTKCPINQLGIKSATDIANKIDGLLQQLKSEPVVALHDGTPDIITSADLSALLLSTSYTPTWSWPELAQIMADLLQGNTTLMSQHLQTIKAPATNIVTDELGQQLLEGRNKTSPSPPIYPNEAEAAPAVLCGDGNDISNLTVEDWYQRLTVWQSESAIVGWKWSEIPMMCAHWPGAIRPAERNRFQGPWRSKLADYDPRASPLLFIGGTADPVLPLRNAYKGAASHEGARVLVQSGPGHCSGYVNPSACTWGHIKEFFASGVLPENNTVCDRDRTAWT